MGLLVRSYGNFMLYSNSPFYFDTSAASRLASTRKHGSYHGFVFAMCFGCDNTPNFNASIV